MRLQKTNRVVNPEPYYEVGFDCSNIQFYEIKNDLWGIFKETGLDDDFWNGWVSDKCDFDGDIEEIVIYNSEELKDFIIKICDAYSISIDDIGNMNIIFTCF